MRISSLRRFLQTNNTFDATTHRHQMRGVLSDSVCSVSSCGSLGVSDTLQLKNHRGISHVSCPDSSVPQLQGQDGWRKDNCVYRVTAVTAYRWQMRPMIKTHRTQESGGAVAMGFISVV